MSIIERVQALSFRPADYIVIGSGILDALDLRRASDIDLVVSETLFEKLRAAGWSRGVKPHGDEVLSRADAEAFLVWDNKTPTPNLAELKADEMIIQGIPFCSPQRVLGWKRRINRPKDQADVVLLEKWLAANSMNSR